MTDKREGPLGNESTQGKLRGQERLATAQRKADLREVLDTEVGRRFYWDLIDRVCNYADVTTQDSGAENTFRHEGRRLVGWQLMNEAREHAPELLSRGYAEQMDRAARERIRREAALKDKPEQEEEADDG